MPEFLRILMRKMIPTSFVDVDRDVSVLVGNLWCVLHSNGLDVGLAKPGAPHLSLVVGRKQTPRLALLFAKRNGRLKGISSFIGLPSRYYVRVGIEKIVKDEEFELKHYGLLYSRDVEGFYWGDKEIQYGDPSLEQLLWDDGYEENQKDSKDV